jgi:glycosyltransferase involved in cell wall biosynthesis
MTSGYSPVFVGIAVERTCLCITFSNGLYVLKYVEQQIKDLVQLEEQVLDIIDQYVLAKGKTSSGRVKVLAAGVSSIERIFRLCSKLWLYMDIVPFKIEWKPQFRDAQQQAYHNALKVDRYFNAQSRTQQPQHVVLAPYLRCISSLGYQYEVNVDFGKVFLARLEDYEKTNLNPKAWSQVVHLSSEFRRQKLVMSFISATPQGGGVALMRHALIRFLRLLEVRTHWHVVKPSSKVFEITKHKFHNVLQGIAPAGVRLTEPDKAIFLKWSTKNARFLDGVFRLSHVIVLDDPQVLGLVPHIKAANPNVKLIYRSHIQIRSDLVQMPGSAQSATWAFLEPFVRRVDLFVSHPIPAFVPHTIPLESVLFMPATTDPLDGLNKLLAPEHLRYYLEAFNVHLVESHQTPLDLERDYFIQIARFDPSKGIPDVLEAYRLVCSRLAKRHLPPQLVLAGHGSIDDPEAEVLLADTLRIIRSDPYREIARDIKAIILPAIDQLLNGTTSGTFCSQTLSALMRKAKCAFQLSHREGFEVKVTEALHKGVPVIAYRAGGLPLQIQNGAGGFLVDVGDTSSVANHALELLLDPALYREMCRKAEESVNPELFTVCNARNWLFLALELHNLKKVVGNGRDVSQLLKEHRVWFI